MVAIGYLAQATLGSTPVVDGLACLPTAPASLTVSIGPGSITIPTTIDATPFGSIAADASDPLVKMGINTTSTSFTLAAPATSGQSINYLIQASLLESDAVPIVLPYYNAANPAQPFSGPNNTGTAQNTQRLQRVQLQLKPGFPANAGTQATPTIDSGWLGLYVVTVSYGQSQLTQSSIVPLPAAPFVAFKLSQLTPGFSRMVTFYSSTAFVVPPGVWLAKIRLCGGGGGGGSGAPNQGGAGGGAGGFAEGIVSLIPGQAIPITVGASGTGAGVSGPNAGTGGTTSFGTLLSATGGLGGANAGTYAYGGGPGSGSGGSLVLLGGYGSDGNGGTFVFPGNGGASAFGGGGRAASAGGYAQQNGAAPGSGGGGCYGTNGNGGSGATGIVIVEY